MLLLSLGAGGGRLHVSTSGGVNPSSHAGALGVVGVAPGAVVYAKARARGVSLLIGVRAVAHRGRADVTYVRHVDSGGSGVAVYVLHGVTAQQRSRFARPYAYALPRPSRLCARYGSTVANLLAEAVLDARATGEVPSYEEPIVGGEPIVPTDAYSVLASIERELAEGAP